MPIFEYACETCSHKFEKLVFNDRVEVACPSCQSQQLRKLFSVFASVSSARDSSPCLDMGGMMGGMMGGGCGSGACGNPEAGCGAS